MLPPHGASRAEGWVAEGRRAAALDLLARLQQTPQAGEVYALAADPTDQAALEASGAASTPKPPLPFHFGRTLSFLVDEIGFQDCAYFGGGSAPLLTAEKLDEIFRQVQSSNSGFALVNNFHSSDWAVMRSAEALIGLSDQLPNDNALGWVLAKSMGFEVDSLEAGAASRADVDTPTDLLMISGHPNLGEYLRDFLRTAPQEQLARLHQIREVIGREASHLTVIGRASSHLWRRLERETRIWVRMFTEERGMIANGRLERGEVRSLIGEALRSWGSERFLRFLEEISDGVLWDTRVWMGHHYRAWPSSADRFAADLGWIDEISEPVLRDLTVEIARASVPIIAGGYGVVAGGLYALLDTIER